MNNSNMTQDVVDDSSLKTVDDEMSLDDLASVLDSTIKCDKVNKCIVFLGMLSTYTESDQLNICLLGESSSGKTYIAQEVAAYFPKEDVRPITNATQKAFKYFGDEMDDILYDYDSEDNPRVTNLERLILLFQDMPSTRFLGEVRPLLSHDQKELTYYSVNQSSQGRRKTEKVVLRGYPSVIFCSANIRVNPQEATRCLLLSPETSSEKIQASVDTAVRKTIDPEKYRKDVESNPQRKALMERVKFIKSMYIDSVIVPFSPEEIVSRFRAVSPQLAPSDNRNVQHVISLIKAVAMLNAKNRAKGRNVIANECDVEAGFELWKGIARTQECGVAPSAMQFYKKCIVPAYKSSGDVAGITLAYLLDYCRQQNVRISPYTISKEFIPALIAANLISYGPVEGRDGRCKYIKPLLIPDEEEKDTKVKKDDTEAYDLSGLDF